VLPILAARFSRGTSIFTVALHLLAICTWIGDLYRVYAPGLPSPTLSASSMHAFKYSWCFLLRYRIALRLMTSKLSLVVDIEAYYLCLGRRPVGVFR
jgi:hypothetical protein